MLIQRYQILPILGTHVLSFWISDLLPALWSHIKLMERSHFLTLGTHIHLEISNSTNTGWSGCVNLIVLIISCCNNTGYSYWADLKISSSPCMKYYQSQRLMFCRTVSLCFRQRWCFTTNEYPCCASTDSYVNQFWGLIFCQFQSHTKNAFSNKIEILKFCV